MLKGDLLYPFLQYVSGVPRMCLWSLSSNTPQIIYYIIMNMPIWSGGRNTLFLACAFTAHWLTNLPIFTIQNENISKFTVVFLQEKITLHPLLFVSLCHSRSFLSPLDASSSSSRHSFPPSFWDSNYPAPPSRPHCDPTGAPTYAMDPYAQALHPGLPHSHAHLHPSESWSYSQSQPYPPPRPLHELYSPPGLDAHYGPLLMPAVRPPHLPTLPGHYDVAKLEPTATWPGLLSPGEVAQSLALNMEPGMVI